MIFETRAISFRGQPTSRASFSLEGHEVGRAEAVAVAGKIAISEATSATAIRTLNEPILIEEYD